jgi:hypothetical protein
MEGRASSPAQRSAAPQLCWPGNLESYLWRAPPACPDEGVRAYV